MVVHYEVIHDDMDFLSVMGYSHVVNDVRKWSRDAQAMGMCDMKLLDWVWAALDIAMCNMDVLKCAPEVGDRLARAHAAGRVFMAKPMQTTQSIETP